MKLRRPHTMASVLGVLGLALSVAACSGNGAAAGPTAINTARPTGAFTLRIAYSNVLTMYSDPLATKWWKDSVGAEFKRLYPQANLQFIPLPGSYDDVVNKLGLLYSNPSTAPDIAEVPNAKVGLYAASNYILPLDSFLTKATWWSDIPQQVKDETQANGHTYAVSHGENNNALMYSNTVLGKAGIALPWQPKTWNDILAAARQIKRRVPGVYPLWINAGTAGGENNLAYGINNFLFGTTTPTIQTADGKFVVDSPGIRAALGFWQQAFADGLTPPESVLFNPNAENEPPNYLQSGKVGITIGSNFYGMSWTKTDNAPYWPQAAQQIGLAYLPTAYDPSKSASTLSGWDVAIGAHTKYPTAAFEFLNIGMEPTNLMNAANWAGWVPPVRSDWNAPLYTNFSPPFAAFFARLLPEATPTPSSSGYTVWARGMENATAAFAQDPHTTVDQAIHILRSYVREQLGSSQVSGG